MVEVTLNEDSTASMSSATAVPVCDNGEDENPNLRSKVPYCVHLSLCPVTAHLLLTVPQPVWLCLPAPLSPSLDPVLQPLKR